MTDRVAIYARVSTGRQEKEETIETQLKGTRDYCRERGLLVVDEYCDENWSGESTELQDRPRGADLIDAIRDRAVDTVIVYRRNRLGRGLMGDLAERDLKTLKATVISVMEPHTNLDGTAGRIARKTDNFISGIVWEMIREDTMNGRYRVVSEGKYLAAQVPFGYKRSEDGRTLEVRKDQARIVKLIFRWAIEGMGLKAIAAKLDDMGIQPPNPKHPARRSNWGWHATTVYKILLAPRYMGEGSYAGHRMTCPAIVSPETFKKAGVALTRRKLNSPRNTKNVYLLQHLVWCRTCGNRFTPRMVNDRRRGTARAIYHCYQRVTYGPKAGHDGVKWRWAAEELETEVKAAVREIYDDPDAFLERVDLDVERLKDSVSEQGQRVALLEERLDGLAEEEKRVITMHRKAYIDETAMLQQLDQVRAERRDVDHELKLARQAAADVDWVTEAADWFRQVCEGASTEPGFLDEDTGERVEPPAEEWRRKIMAVVEKVWVEADGGITLQGPFAVSSKLMSYR